MTTIQIELCKEDRARLDAIIKALESKVAEVGATTQEEVKTPLQAKLESVAKPITEETLPWEEPKKEEYQPDLEAIRELAMTLAESGRKDVARSVLAKYGAKNISSIKPSDYLAIYKDFKQAVKDAVKEG